MKKILSVLFVIILSSCEDDPVKPNVQEFEYMKHSYLYFVHPSGGPNCSTYIHNPDCPCLHEN